MALALYFHWPFCTSKCSYCDFNSHIRSHIDENRFQRAFIRELQYLYQKVGKRSLKSIFFGGGTPSLMSVTFLQNLIETSLSLFDPINTIEISLEANPSSFEVEKFLLFKEIGINRLSLGLQALNDKDLQYLGRKHNVKEALYALEKGQKIFNNLSFDLIYARRLEQTLSAWEQELKQALSFNTPHISLYQLTIEPQTAFARRYQKGDILLPSDDHSADLYELTQELTFKAGFERYEISNYAKKGFECQHHLVYWRYQDYAGIGPGVHGRLTIKGKKWATYQERHPEHWLKAVGEQGTGYKIMEEIPPLDQAKEALLMGLRLKEGVDFSCVETIIDPQKLSLFCKEGFLEQTKTHLKATDIGKQCLNSLLQQLL